MKCIARCKSNPFKQCSLNALYNKLCNKHNKEEKIQTIETLLFNETEVNNFIKDYINIYTKNTKQSELFLKKNIILTKYILQYYNYNFDVNLNKKQVILLFKTYIIENNKYILNLKHIIKIQNFFRQRIIKNINFLKGPGLFLPCVNETDFYTFEDKKKINYEYLFSFIDEKKNIYFFDIRSFKLLIDNKFTSNNKIINPYNRLPISIDIINKYNKLVHYLKKNNITIDFEPEILSKEQLFNQTIIQTFQKIDKFGYNTSIEWFTKLSIFQLRQLWIQLEDIWNYRSNLSPNEKNNIIQQIKPQPFSKFKLLNTKYFYNNDKTINKKKIQESILEDFNIFITSGINESSSNIGCLYVLTALAGVSHQCIQSMPWLLQ
tara:strand:- start:6 stop:1136 length:1131 start_codon:yes stop_codon:yes gene_type:complete